MKMQIKKEKKNPITQWHFTFKNISVLTIIYQKNYDYQTQ